MILNHAKKVENITDEKIKIESMKLADKVAHKMEAMKLADKAAPKSP
jgi:hypothetical protein